MFSKLIPDNCAVRAFCSRAVLSDSKASTPSGPINSANPAQLQDQIASAATTNQVSAALTSALQHFENAVPNAQGNWQNSPTGAVGAMQVMPKALAGMVS